MEITNGIIQVIDKLSEKFGIAVDWSSQNVMPYLQGLGQKIIKYEIATSSFWFVLGVIICIFGFICLAKSFKKSINLLDMNNNECFLIIQLLFFIGGIVLILWQVYNIITCCTFPEKIIFGYVQDLFYQIEAL